MAHRQPHLRQDSAAIFSPSVARIAASTARDWSYIDTWLASKFSGRAVPPFERNSDTLKALLALASLNEAADEECQLLARAEAEALRELSDSGPGGQSGELRDKLLNFIEDELPREGKVALDSIASMAIQAGVAFPEPQDLGNRMIDLQKSLQEAEQMKDRVGILQRHVEHDTERMGELLRNLESDDYKPPPEMAKQNLELQRKIKTMTTQLSELEDRISSLATSVNSSHPTVDDVARDEQDYLALLSQKKQLDLQLAVFDGLPSDPDMARGELDALRKQLRGATSDRDAVFEGLVERESPVKRRH